MGCGGMNSFGNCLIRESGVLCLEIKQRKTAAKIYLGVWIKPSFAVTPRVLFDWKTLRGPVGTLRDTVDLVATGIQSV